MRSQKNKKQYSYIYNQDTPKSVSKYIEDFVFFDDKDGISNDISVPTTTIVDIPKKTKSSVILLFSRDIKIFVQSFGI